MKDLFFSFLSNILLSEFIFAVSKQKTPFRLCTFNSERACATHDLAKVTVLRMVLCDNRALRIEV